MKLERVECLKCGAAGPMHPVGEDHAGWLCPKCYALVAIRPQHIARLAEELHRQYRAAEKSMRRASIGCGSINRLLHDHGWKSCGQKKYFIRRAELILRRAAMNNPRCVNEALDKLNAVTLQLLLLNLG